MGHHTANITASEQRTLPARKITRRRVLETAAASAAFSSPAVQALARPLMVRGGSPQAALAQIAGVRFLNTAGTDSPADVPYTVKMEFAEGEVPSGSIAVPQVGGVDQVYQADNRVYWGTDGSLFSAVFHIIRNAAHTAGGFVSFDFSVRSGAYSNTSSTTLADMQAYDYKVTVTNCHSAQIGANESNGLNSSSSGGNIVALQMSGGSIVGTKLYHLDGTGATTVSAKGLSGTGAPTGALISMSSGVVSIDAAGSGGTLTNGTGAFTVSAATVLASVISGGNHANGVSATWYARGPVVNALVVRTTVPNHPHRHVSIYIEEWKKVGGAALGTLAMGVLGNFLIDFTNTLRSYTYDLDWIGPDGSTVIRGTSTGYTNHQTIWQFGGSDYLTCDKDAEGDWSVNDAAYRAIIPMRTQVQCDHQKRAGAIMPWLPHVPPATVLQHRPVAAASMSHSSYNLNSTLGSVWEIGDYQPGGTAGIRCAINAGASGNQIAPQPEVDGLYWACQRAGQTAEAAVWLRNMRVSAAHMMGFAMLGAAIYEPSTMYVPSVIPASVQTFTGMTPTRENNSAHPSWILPEAQMNAHIAGNSQLSLFSAASDTSHQICGAMGAYLATGRQWFLDALHHQASTTIFAMNPGSKRQGSLGATNYYGIQCQVSSAIRAQAWWLRTMMYAASMAPTTWADGTTNVERDHIQYCIDSSMKFWLDLVPFIGTVKLGQASVSDSKTIDFTGSGIHPEQFTTQVPNNYAGDTPFMLTYQFAAMAHGSYLLKGKVPRVQQYLEYIRPSAVTWWATPGSHHFHATFRRMTLDGPVPSNPVDLTWSAPNLSDPKIMIWPMDGVDGGLGLIFDFTSGSDIVQMSYVAGGPPKPCRATSILNGELMANGSRIRLTSDRVDNTTLDGPVPPSPYDMTTEYYWKNVGLGTGQLCTDAALTTVAGPASATVQGVSWWVVFSNTAPSDTAGIGEYRNGFGDPTQSSVCDTHGALCLMKAYGIATGADLDDAIANTYAILSNMPNASTYFPNDLTWQYDTSKG